MSFLFFLLFLLVILSHDPTLSTILSTYFFYRSDSLYDSNSQLSGRSRSVVWPDVLDNCQPVLREPAISASDWSLVVKNVNGHPFSLIAILSPIFTSHSFSHSNSFSRSFSHSNLLGTVIPIPMLFFQGESPPLQPIQNDAAYKANKTTNLSSIEEALVGPLSILTSHLYSFSCSYALFFLPFYFFLPILSQIPTSSSPSSLPVPGRVHPTVTDDPTSHWVNPNCPWGSSSTQTDTDVLVTLHRHIPTEWSDSCTSVGETVGVDIRGSGGAGAVPYHIRCCRCHCRC